jgi:hypothetical protein
VLWGAVACRLPHLHTVSIELEGGRTAGEFDPMLCQPCQPCQPSYS